jgi:hypothetical protein
LNLFEDCFEEEPLLAKHAKKSAEKVKKAAAKAEQRAGTEFDNRLNQVRRVGAKKDMSNVVLLN